ncbi:MAG: glutamyl-tRNA reductase, partial [Deltaproteobacteria bacterium]
SYVAVELAKKIFGDLQDKSVLIVGAGEMCELAAKHLRAAGVRTLRVANRTWQRAVDLARRMGGEAVPFEGLREFLRDSDIVLSSTGASRPIILKDDVSMALKRRRGRPIFFIDLAVPRDIDPDVNELPDAYLYDIDDLRTVAQENARDRLKEAERARELVEEEVEKFTRWYRSLEAAPTIRELREWAERVREGELQDALKGLDLDEKDRERIERMSRRILNKLLHPAIDFLKHTAANGRGKEYVEMIRCLFGLREP